MALRLVVLGAAGLLLGCGHSIGPGLAANHPAGFDFRDPCQLAPPPHDPAPEDRVVLRYLGAGGLYVGWRGHAILTGPFFSNPSFGDVVFRRMRFRWGAIREALDGVPMGRVGAILAGHSHYDHIGDLPVVAGHFAPWARVYVNRSGANALEAYPSVHARVKVLDGHEREWLYLEDARGRPLPFRVRVIPSSHAPHFDHVTLWKHTNDASRRRWRERRYGFLGAGQPYALVIDLLGPSADGEAGDAAAVRFRIHYQDAASTSPDGIPPPELLDRPYDLAVTVMASAHLVKPYPEDLLRTIRPRHVLVTHYENFFAPWKRRRGFVVLLTRHRAEAFLRRISSALPESGGGPSAPVEGCRGPSTPVWTMPLVGEWIAFRPADPDARDLEEDVPARPDGRPNRR